MSHDPEREADKVYVDQDWLPYFEASTQFRAAVRFFRTFQPKASVDYTAVLAHAKLEYATADATFKALDEKAGSILNYLGSGTGLVTAGGIAGMASSQIDARIVAFTIPSLLCAAGALACAAYVRSAQLYLRPPTAATLVELAENPVLPKQAGAREIPLWHYSTEGMNAINDQKASWLNASTWLMIAAITLLIFPVLSGVYFKLSAPNAPPAIKMSLEITGTK